MKGDAADPKALIREAFAMDGITGPECRSILLDWALSLPVGADMHGAIRAMLVQYADAPVDHPMTATLREGLAEADAPRRRGGRAARLGEA